VAMLVGAGLAFVSAIAAGALIEGRSFREVFRWPRGTPLSAADALGSIPHPPATPGGRTRGSGNAPQSEWPSKGPDR
jgi:hypothetical protein